MIKKTWTQENTTEEFIFMMDHTGAVSLNEYRKWECLKLVSIWTRFRLDTRSNIKYSLINIPQQIIDEVIEYHKNRIRYIIDYNHNDTYWGL